MYNVHRSSYTQIFKLKRWNITRTHPPFDRIRKRVMWWLEWNRNFFSRFSDGIAHIVLCESIIIIRIMYSPTREPNVKNYFSHLHRYGVCVCVVVCTHGMSQKIARILLQRSCNVSISVKKHCKNLFYSYDYIKSSLVDRLLLHICRRNVKSVCVRECMHVNKGENKRAIHHQRENLHY